MSERRVVDVRHLTRVEGHGNISVAVREGRLEHARWQVVETPRYFEAMLAGTHYSTAAILASRICGICSISHCLAALREAAAGHVAEIGVAHVDEELTRFALGFHRAVDAIPDEDQLVRIEVQLAIKPCSAAPQDVGPVRDDAVHALAHHGGHARRIVDGPGQNTLAPALRTLHEGPGREAGIDGEEIGVEPGDVVAGGISVGAGETLHVDGATVRGPLVVDGAAGQLELTERGEPPQVAQVLGPQKYSRSKGLPTS